MRVPKSDLKMHLQQIITKCKHSPYQAIRCYKCKSGSSPQSQRFLCVLQKITTQELSELSLGGSQPFNVPISDISMLAGNRACYTA